jgi:hypothetical protein
MAQNQLVALKNLHLHTVDLAIVLGVAHAPVVNVVADNLAGAQLGSNDAEDACAAAAIEHALALQRHVKERGDDHLGGLVGAAAKGLDGLDTYIKRSLIAGSRIRGNRRIGGSRRIMAFESALGVVDNTTAIHVDGIEAVGLPHLVPVVVLQLLGGKGHLHIGHGEVVENGLQPNGVETVGGNIADEVVVALLKGIDTAVA